MSLNTEHWKKFRISDIFCPFINGRGITEQEIEDNPGKLAAIQSSSENNGCMGFTAGKWVIKLSRSLALQLHVLAAQAMCHSSPKDV